MTKQAEIRGEVTYREGDGTNLTIRPGPVEVHMTAMDVVLSWTDGESRGSAAMPLTEFHRFVLSGDIVTQP